MKDSLREARVITQRLASLICHFGSDLGTSIHHLSLHVAIVYHYADGKRTIYKDASIKITSVCMYFGDS